MHGGYRFGFNGQEKDDEVYNTPGSSYTTEYWQYDSRLGRRWNRDPVVMSWESPYAAFRNVPTVLSDPNGDCPDCDEKNPNAENETVFRPEGAEHDYIKGDDGWTMIGGTLPEATASASKEPTSLSSNPIYRNMQQKGITSFGSGIKWGEGLGYETEFSKGLYTLYAPLYGAMMIPALPTLMPIAGEAGFFSLEASLTKGGISSFTDAGSQFIAGKGSFSDRLRKINLISVASSGILSNPFASSSVGATFNFTIDERFRTLGDPGMSLSKITIDFGMGFISGRASDYTTSLLKKETDQLIIQSVLEPMVTVPSTSLGEAVKQKLDE